MPRRSKRNAHDDVTAPSAAAAAGAADPTAAAADPHGAFPTGTVEDPLAPQPLVEDPLAPHAVTGAGGGDPDQAALEAGEEAAAAAMEAAAAAEATIGDVLGDVGDMHHVSAQAADEGTEEDQMAMAAAAAAAAAAVQAADGMAVVVDQALLATAAAAAASQVADVLADHPSPDAAPPGLAPPLPEPSHVVAPHASLSPLKVGEEHGDLLEARREKDRRRYSAMSPEARAAYNAHRRDLYHKQGEAARKRRRERERDRYHSLEGDNKKSRNERRAQLERDRYNRLTKEELAERNAKRRERAKQRKGQGKAAMQGEGAVPMGETIPPPPQLPGVPAPLAEGAMAEASLADANASAALAAEVAEQVIAGTDLEGAMEAVNPTVQI